MKTAPSKPISVPRPGPISSPAPAPAPIAADAAVPTDAPAPATPRPSDFEAPPIHQAVTTSVTDPLPWSRAATHRSNRWIYLGGGLVAVGAIVGIVLAASGGGGGGEKQPAENKVAMTASGAEPTAKQPEPKQPEPKQPEPEQPDPQGSAAPPVVDPPPVADPDPTPAKIPAKVIRPDHRPDHSLDPAKPGPAKPGPAKPDPAKPDPTRPITSKGSITSAAALQAEWRAVRAAITALEKSHGAAAADKPFTRFRRINIGASMANPEQIAPAAAELAEIRQLIVEARALTP